MLGTLEKRKKFIVDSITKELNITKELLFEFREAYQRLSNKKQFFFYIEDKFQSLEVLLNEIKKSYHYKNFLEDFNYVEAQNKLRLLGFEITDRTKFQISIYKKEEDEVILSCNKVEFKIKSYNLMIEAIKCFKNVKDISLVHRELKKNLNTYYEKSEYKQLSLFKEL